MIPTEPIGSIPRPLRLIEAIATTDGTDPALDPIYDEAIRDTIARFEATGSPVISDGEQRKYHNFWTFCDDTTTSRDTAFAKIRARVLGTELASEIVGGG
jgi:5-methyltetrahydropteroyltriglutamate--homocysteine methyltransferase